MRRHAWECETSLTTLRGNTAPSPPGLHGRVNTSADAVEKADKSRFAKGGFYRFFYKHYHQEIKNMTNIINTINAALENASISNAARDLVNQVLEDAADPVGNNEDLTIRDLLNALEDGAYLSMIGADDQEAVEEAYDFLNTINI